MKHLTYHKRYWSHGNKKLYPVKKKNCHSLLHLHKITNSKGSI